MEFLRDLWGFLRQRKKFWLLPVIVALVGFGALIVLTSGSAIAPFIYTLVLVPRQAILGISAYYHDSAAALLVDGAIVAAAQEERFSRTRHDASFPIARLPLRARRGAASATTSWRRSPSTTSRS